MRRPLFGMIGIAAASLFAATPTRPIADEAWTTGSNGVPRRWLTKFDGSIALANRWTGEAHEHAREAARRRRQMARAAA